MSCRALGIIPVAMRARNGRGWKQRPFGVVMLAAIVYHGVGEVLSG